MVLTADACDKTALLLSATGNDGLSALAPVYSGEDSTGYALCSVLGYTAVMDSSWASAENVAKKYYPDFTLMTAQSVTTDIYDAYSGAASQIDGINAARQEKVVGSTIIDCGKDMVSTLKTFNTDTVTYTVENGKLMRYVDRDTDIDIQATKVVYTRACVSDPVPAKPTVSIKAAFGGRTVTFQSDSPENEIYYQFGSSNITADCDHIKAGGTIFLNRPMTGRDAAMYFKAYRGRRWSSPAKWGVLNVQIDKPLITPSGPASQNKFKIYTQTKDSYIVYTLDGTMPAIEEGTNKLKVSNGRLIWSTSGVIDVPKGRTVKAIAVRCGLVTSDPLTFTNR
ncbi:MAG: chitobiase/beta-hexosaminidase C-terminal domain-containing protein [Oscillospiraceae bacterium]|nr:chitobiase/beta-hexosaminidase C-terminal domain-containing protein [Oscillospiraceae bacterium]